MLIIFLSFFLLLELYVVTTGKGYKLPVLLYWLGFVGSLGVFLLSALNRDNTSRGIVILEMLLLIVIHSFMLSGLSPFYSWGYDSNYSIGSASRIIQSGWPIQSEGTPATVLLVSEWPTQSMLAGTVYLVGAVDWGFILQFLSSPLYCLVGLSLYSFGCRFLSLSSNEAAVLAVVSPLAYGLMVLNGLGNPGLGTPLLFLSIYLLGRNSVRPDARFSLLTAVFISAIVLAHHLSAFYLLLICVFFVTYRALTRSRHRTGQWRLPLSYPPASLRISGKTLILVVCLVVFYWSTIGTSVIERLFQAFVGVSTVQVTGISSKFLSDSSTVAGLAIDASIAIVCALQIVRERLLERRNSYGAGWSTFLFSSFLLCIVIVSSRIVGAQLEFSRSTGLAYVFLFGGFLAVRKSSRTTLFRSAAVVTAILLLYSCNQMQRLDSTTGIIEPWAQHSYSNGGYAWGGFIKYQDLEAVLWLPSNDPIIGDQVIYSLGEGWRNISVVPSIGVFKGNLSSAGDIGLVLIRDIDLSFVFVPYQTSESFALTASTLNELMNTDLVFDNGGVLIFSLDP